MNVFCHVLKICIQPIHQYIFRQIISKQLQPGYIPKDDDLIVFFS